MNLQALRGFGPKKQPDPIKLHMAWCSDGAKCKSENHRCDHTLIEHEKMGWTCPHKSRETP